MAKAKKIIEISEVKDEKEWENFNLARKCPSYFQSWGWGQVQKNDGIETKRYGIYENLKLIGIFQAFNIRAKRGHYLHIRQGPVIDEWNEDVIFQVFNFIKKIAKKKNFSFIRISPLFGADDKNNINLLNKIGFRQSPIHNVDAENRWVLNIEQDLDSIMSKMRKTTRYVIRKGMNLNIKIVRTNKLDDIDKFFSVYYETAKAKNFVPLPLVKEEFEEFKKNNNAFIYFALLDKKILSTAIITYYGKEAIYRHGATSFEGRNTPSSYLLQWQAIQDAKKRGLSIYNFYGIAKDDNPKNPWYGLSQFKKGFGGEQVDFIHSQDLPLSKKYWLTYLIDYFTELKKGYNI